MITGTRQSTQSLSIGRKLWRFNWLLFLLICIVCSIGLLMQYSVAGGNMQPWADPQLKRFIIGICGLFIVAMIDIKYWHLVAYFLFVITFLALLGVQFFGVTGGGAQRWIDLKFIRLQPSEVMKIMLLLALARYYHDLNKNGHPQNLHGGLFGWLHHVLRWIIVPLIAIFACAGLTYMQPDLGTALLLALLGVSMMFIAGVSIWLFLMMGVGAAGTIWAILASKGTSWQILKDYQYRRIDVFLSPENLASESGYHILQSKIALGSGGMFGRGLLQGTQGRLNFLPEKQTDFIFTALGEEFGLFGTAGLMLLYCLIIALCLLACIRIQHRFGRLLVVGLTMNFFSYFAVNMAMVMGAIPIVGVPLPLISYGGTSMWSLLLGFGLIISASIHREQGKRR